MKISIYGAGHLAKSFINGISQTNNIQIKIYNRTKSKAEELSKKYPNLKVVESPIELIDNRTIVFIIIPPIEILKLEADFIGKMIKNNAILISCANGLHLEDLTNFFNGLKACRLLPNINWQILKGTSLIKYNTLITEEEKHSIRTFLGTITELSEIQDELKFDKIGKITSCGPGIFSALIAVMQDQFGLISEHEKKLFQNTLINTIEYQSMYELTNEDIIYKVANKTGLTKVGVDAIKKELPNKLKLVSDSMDFKIAERNKQIREKITFYNNGS